MIYGDGIGPEMMFHIKEAIKNVRAPVEFEDVFLNSKNVTEGLIENAILAIKRNGVAIKGNIETDHTNPISVSTNVILR